MLNNILIIIEYYLVLSKLNIEISNIRLIAVSDMVNCLALYF